MNFPQQPPSDEPSAHHPPAGPVPPPHGPPVPGPPAAPGPWDLPPSAAAVVARSDIPTEEKKRLHPLTPLLTSMRMLIAILAAASWQMLINNNLDIGLYIALATAVFGGISGWLSWMFTGYQFVGRELHITEGVLFRRHRSIPLERLQSVEVGQPLFARPFRLAALRLEVAGAASTEAPLAYLKLTEANHLRTELLRLSQVLQDGEDPAAGSSPVAGADSGEATPITQTFQPVPTEPVERPLAYVPSSRLIGAYILDSATGFFLAIAIVLTMGLTMPAAFALMGFTGAALIMFIGVVGIISAILKDWEFSLSETGDRLWVRRGITERRSQVVPLERVTLVVKETPVWWRIYKWSRVRAATASLGLQGGGDFATHGTILPVGDEVEANFVANEALRSTQFSGLTMHPIPKRARFRLPATWWVHAAGLNPHVFACQYGLLTRRILAIPYARIQSVRVVQGPWQRALDLATVEVQIAGSLGLNTAAVNRDVNEAMQIAAELRQRSDAAAAAELSPSKPPARPTPPL